MALRFLFAGRCAALCALLPALINAPAKAGVTYTITELGPGAPSDLNTKGAAVLYMTRYGAPVGPTYLWDGVQFAYLPLSSLPPGDFTSVALAENDSGQLAGLASTGDCDSCGIAQNGADAVFWSGGAGQQPTIIGKLSTVGTPTHVSASGHVILYPGSGQSYRSSIWSADGVILLPTLGDAAGDATYANGINDSDLVVGSDVTPDGKYHAVTWSNGHIHQLDMGTFPQGEATAVADDGEIAGRVVDSSNTLYLAFWSPTGVLQTIDLAGGSSNVTAINSAHQAVGWYNPSSASNYGSAALFENGTITLLKDLVPADNSIILDNAVDINEKGQILVQGHIPSGTNKLLHTLLLTPVSSMAQALSIVGGLRAASSDDVNALAAQPSSGVSLSDAVHLARKVAGLE